MALSNDGCVRTLLEAVFQAEAKDFLRWLRDHPEASYRNSPAVRATVEDLLR